jgi:ABC-2 type transport system permease protein
MLYALLRILALTRKELLAILKDPRSRFSLILPPILQCLIYGYVATYDLNHVPYAAFDHDRSAASRQLLARIDGSGVFQRVANLDRDLEVKTFIDQRRALLVVRIDRDFERNLFSGMPATVQVIADGAIPIPPAQRWATLMLSSMRSTSIGAIAMAKVELRFGSPPGLGTTPISKPAGT